MKAEITSGELRDILDPIINQPGLECDGFTRLAFTFLSRNGIKAEPYVGVLTVESHCIPLHYWLCCGSFLIDYKARMWLGDGDSVPHGIMNIDDVKHMYEGDLVDMKILPDFLCEILLK